MEIRRLGSSRMDHHFSFHDIVALIEARQKFPEFICLLFTGAERNIKMFIEHREAPRKKLNASWKSLAEKPHSEGARRHYAILCCDN